VALFAIGDIHGRFDLMRKALAGIEWRSPSPNTVVFLGDYIDRGSQSREVVETLMRGPTRADDIWICLRGNHEQMMVDALAGRARMGWWLENGGQETMESFDRNVPAQVIAWCEALPFCHETARYFFVHAGIRPGLELDQQEAEALLWIRDVFLDDKRDHGKHIVHVHTPRHAAELLPNRTNLDSGAVYWGTLSVGRFDAEPSVFEVS